MLLAPALDALASIEPRDVGGATRRKSAIDLPQHRSVVDRLVRVRGGSFAREPTARDAGGVELRGDHEATRSIDTDADLLQDDGRQRSTAQCQHLDGRRRLAGSEPKVTRELAARKVMTLLDKVSLERETAQFVAVDFEVSADGIGASGEALALLDRVDRGESIDDGDALGERERASPQPDQAIGQVGGDVLRPPGQNGRRADWHRAQPLTSSSSFSWPARC